MGTAPHLGSGGRVSETLYRHSTATLRRDTLRPWPKLRHSNGMEGLGERTLSAFSVFLSACLLTIPTTVHHCAQLCTTMHHCTPLCTTVRHYAPLAHCYHFFSSRKAVQHVCEPFVCFFLGWRIPNLIIRRSVWKRPNSWRRTQETVLDPYRPSLWPTLLLL